MDRSSTYREFYEILDNFDRKAITIAAIFFDNHMLPYLVQRTKYEYGIDLGVSRPLADIWIELLNLNHINFLEFYEGIYVSRKVPHYEDIIITIIANIIAHFLANRAEDNYKKWMKESEENAKINEDFMVGSKELIEYLIKIYALRDVISSENEFATYKDHLKNQILFKNDNNLTFAQEEKLKEILNSFAKEHSFESLNNIYDTLINESNAIIKNVDDIKFKVTLTDVKEKYRPGDYQSYRKKDTIYGIQLNSGIGSGKLRIIESQFDWKKVQDGDVCLLKNFLTIWNPALRKSNAVICEGFGGISSHIGIMLREFGIPGVTIRKADKLIEEFTVKVDGDYAVIEIPNSFRNKYIGFKSKFFKYRI